MAYIGVDRSGELKRPPFIMLATREGRKQTKKIIRFSRIDDKKYSKEIEKRYLKIATILTFLCIKPPFIKYGDKIHIDKDYPGSNREEEFFRYMCKLFVDFFPKKYPFGDPDIEFHTTKNSDFVKKADKKCDWAKKGRYISEKCPDLNKYLKCLE